MYIAVTGASGQLGRLVVEELLNTGTPAEEIIAIVRDPAKIADFTARGVQVRKADYNDRASYDVALKGIERLLLISTPGPGAADLRHKNVIDAAVAAGVQYLAYTSILHADTSSNPLAAEHAATERLIMASGLNFALLRNSYYFDVPMNFLSVFLATGAITNVAGNGKISGATPADFAAAAATVLKSRDTQPCIYELGGAPFTYSQLAETITQVTGISVINREVTEAERLAELQNSGVPSEVAPLFVGSELSIRKGDMYTESEALARLVGRPLTSLSDAVAKIASLSTAPRFK